MPTEAENKRVRHKILSLWKLCFVEADQKAKFQGKKEATCNFNYRIYSFYRPIFIKGPFE